MPSQNGVGRHDGRDLPKHTTPKPVPQFGETASLGIIEPQSPPCEPPLEDAVLFSQERDDGVLLMAKPTALHRNQELERKHPRSLRQRRSIQFRDSFMRCRLFRVQNAKAAPPREHLRWLYDVECRATAVPALRQVTPQHPIGGDQTKTLTARSIARWCRTAMISRCREARDWTTNRSEWNSETMMDATTAGYRRMPATSINATRTKFSVVVRKNSSRWFQPVVMNRSSILLWDSTRSSYRTLRGW